MKKSDFNQAGDENFLKEKVEPFLLVMEESEKILSIIQNMIRLGAVMNDSIRDLLADKMVQLNQDRAMLLEDASSSEKMEAAHKLTKESNFHLLIQTNCKSASKSKSKITDDVLTGVEHFRFLAELFRLVNDDINKQQFKLQPQHHQVRPGDPVDARICGRSVSDTGDAPTSQGSALVSPV